MTLLDGKVIVITASSCCIGATVAEAFAHELHDALQLAWPAGRLTLAGSRHR
jgi:hypothetical protein